MNYRMHVVSHTHWDREWYLTFQQFRTRLVDLIDHLLDTLDREPDFRYFNFDGQTIVLEDYLQIRPQNEARLRKYISEGRILVGPWYQLNDEYLVSGESTVRSLFIGHRIAEKFGAVTKVGYLPDQFGNISQMPQIFREFGIDNAIFGRGIKLFENDKMEMVWEGADGSEVLGSCMAFWYNNAQRFPSDTEEALNYVLQIRDRMAPHAATPELLLMNGVDHLDIQDDLPDIIRQVNERLEGDRLIHSTLPKYIDAVKDYIEKHDISLRRVKGELRRNIEDSVLPGTLSSRMYIKQANNETETWISKYAEPSCSFAWMSGQSYPSDMLTYAWKFLMQNHPHDSICGCSIDQVHREMMPRFEQVQQVCREFTKRSLKHIADRVKTKRDSLVIFNPLSWVHSDRLTADIDFPVSDVVLENPVVDPLRDIRAIEILDADEIKVPFKLLGSKIVPKSVLSPSEVPMVIMVRRFTVEFVAEDVPACGYKTYSIYPVAVVPKFEGSLTGTVYSDNSISNGLVMVSPYFGGVTVYDHKAIETAQVRGQYFDTLGILEDGGDVGDEYLYRKPLCERIITTLGSSPEIEIIDNSPVSATLKLSTVMNLPVAEEPDAQGRCAETVECPVTSYYTITANSPRVDVVTEIENNAKDHRLRVLFPTGIATDMASVEGQFDVLERPVRAPEEWGDGDSFFPQRSWVDLNDGDRGLTIINKGLPEYEVYNDDARTIAVTLLRCVGWLARQGLYSVTIPTPDAQCPGKHRFEYAILPHKGTWNDAKVWQQAHQHNVPLIYIQTGAHVGDLSGEQSFITIESAELIVTAIKKAEDRDSLIVRFFNISSEDVHEARISVAKITSARLVNLNEEPGNELIVEPEGAVRIDVPSKKMVTIEFGF